jgi:hypothetical protein
VFSYVGTSSLGRKFFEQAVHVFVGMHCAVSSPTGVARRDAMFTGTGGAQLISFLTIV